MKRYYSIVMAVWLYCLSGVLFGQISLTGAGVEFGAGSMSGSAAVITTFAAEPYLEFKQTFISSADIRMQAVYIRDMNAIIPGTNSSKYFPYLQGAAVSVFQSAPITKSLHLNYSLGVLVLNDRTYEDINEWGFGAAAGAKIEHSLFESTDVRISAGAKYGLVFTTNNPGYFIYFAAVSWGF